MEIEVERNLKSFVNALKDRCNDDWDTVIAIAGEERSGKSSLSVLLGMLIDSNFDLVKNVAYLPTHEEIEQKFKKLGCKQYFSVDEAIKAMYKMRFMDKLQSRINEMYATEAWKNNITALCIPRFTDLNEFFRNHRVKIWIQVIDRGFAVAFAKDEKNVFFGDPWHMKENNKIMMMAQRSKKYVEMNNDDAIAAYKKSKNFFFAFNYPKLPEEVEKEYQRLKISFRDVEVQKDISEKAQAVISLYNTGMKQVEIARHINLSPPLVCRIISEHNARIEADRKAKENL